MSDRFQVTSSLLEFWVDAGETATVTNIGSSTVYGATEMFPSIATAAWSLAAGASRTEDNGPVWVRTADGSSSTVTVDPVATGTFVDVGSGTPASVVSASPAGAVRGQLATINASGTYALADPSWVDARNYGVVGNNSAADNAAIQAALDAAEARVASVAAFSGLSASVTVKLPAGWFKVTGLTIASSVRLRGEGVSTVLLLTGSSNANVIQSKNFGSATVIDSEIQVSDLRIVGNGANQTATNPQAFVTADTAVSTTPTTVPVNDTTGLPSTGRVWSGFLQIAYTGTTSTSLTGCTIYSGSDTARKSSWITPAAGTGHGVALQGKRCRIDNVFVSGCYGSGIYLQGPDNLASGALYGAENDIGYVRSQSNSGYGIEVGPGASDGLGGKWVCGPDNLRGGVLIRSGDWQIAVAHLTGTAGATIPGPIPQALLVSANYVKFGLAFFDTWPGTPVVLDCSIQGWTNILGFDIGQAEYYLCSNMAGSAGNGVVMRGVKSHANITRPRFAGVNMWSPFAYNFSNGPITTLVGTQDLTALPGGKLQVASVMDFSPASAIGGTINTSTDVLSYTGRQMSQTKLTADAAIGDTTITVNSTTGFDSSGKLSLLAFDGTTYTRMVLTYTGKTATTFTGIPSSSTGSVTTAASSSGERGGVAQHFFTGVTGGLIASRGDDTTIYCDPQFANVTEMRASDCVFRSFRQGRINMQTSDDYTLTNCVSGGKKMRSLGTASIAAGASTIAVTHNLAEAPTRVILVPTADPQASRRYWVSAKASTTFTISLDANATTNPITFDWLAEVTA